MVNSDVGYVESSRHLNLSVQTNQEQMGKILSAEYAKVHTRRDIKHATTKNIELDTERLLDYQLEGEEEVDYVDNVQHLNQ